MIKLEDDCVGCPPEMGCLGSGCPYRNVPHKICDSCGEEVDLLYWHGTDQWCFDCMTDEFEEVRD